jgi:hypothetical protein
VETSDPEAPDIVTALLAAAGLRPPPEELTILTSLYVRFARERAALARIDFGPSEPATTFALEPPATVEP